MKVKVLMTEEELLALMTDEKCKAPGYPGREAYLLLRELGELAAKWRVTKTRQAVEEYHALYFKLVDMGVDMDDQMEASDYLPEKLMPVVESAK